MLTPHNSMANNNCSNATDDAKATAQHRLANQRFADARELSDRKLAFLTRLGCSPDILAKESAKLTSTIAAAEKAAKQKHHPN